MKKTCDGSCFYEKLFEHHPAQMAIVDEQGVVTAVNRRKKCMGSCGIAIGKKMFTGCADRRDIDMREALMRCIKTGKSEEFPEMRCGENFLSVKLLPMEGGAAVIADDITERVVTTRQLREKHRELKAIMHAARDAIIVMGPDKRVMHWNPGAANITGYSKNQAIGELLHELIAPSEYAVAYERGLEHFVKTGEGPAVGHTAERKIRCADGSVIDAELSLSKFKTRKGWHSVGILRNVTERVNMLKELRESREVLRQMSFTDDLTGLYNRRYFNLELEREISFARRHNQPLSIVMFDIDHFKRINDDYGHDNGDCALKLVSGEFKSILRSEDVACRWGGEEFVVILPMSSKEDSGRLTSRLQLAIGKIKLPFAKNDVITISAGVTQFQQDDTIDIFLKRVDDLLFSAKNSGRNRVEIG